MSVVLLYHRVAAPSHDPYDLAVHPDRFAAHVEHLLELGCTEPLGDAVGGRSRSRVAITFDDGYADNATVAAPLLVDAGLPATWFITTSTLGRRRFWWDSLAEALLGDHSMPESLDIEVGGRELWLDLRHASTRRTSLRFLHRRLLPLTPELIRLKVDEVIRSLGVAAAGEDDITMSEEQLRTLAASPLQEVGAHTRTHAHLNSQSPGRQREEILGSVRELELLLQRPIRHFAYPFGGRGTVGPLATQLVAESGCRYAFTTVRGQVTRRRDRYLLPRLTVLDWEKDEFAARLATNLRHR